MIDIIAHSISAYAITFVICSSSLFESMRVFIKKNTPYLKMGDYKHFVECRMCVSFWSSLLVCICYGSYSDLLTIYGFSYFLATQER